MRDPNRIFRITALLAQAWAKVPDQRLGQLLENLLRFSDVYEDPDTWNTEDDKWEELLEHFIKTGRFKGE